MTVNTSSDIISTNLAVPKPSLSNSNPTHRPIAIFSDFDGTIFLQDTGHILFDNYGCGAARRKELDESIGDTRTFREASEEMWGSLNVSLQEGLQCLAQNLVIDRDFETFLNFCESHKIPFNVISAGLKPLLRGALDHFLGSVKSNNIGIVSNDGDISEAGGWKPIWRHDCELGHDKALSIKEFKQTVSDEQPLIVFIGDGVSDLAAASQADVLFARKGLKLETYCIQNKIPYIPYDSFADIELELEDLVKDNANHITRPASLVNSTSEVSLCSLDISPMQTIPSSPSTTKPLIHALTPLSSATEKLPSTGDGVVVEPREQSGAAAS